jgi:hypothetical protein
MDGIHILYKMNEWRVNEHATDKPTSVCILMPQNLGSNIYRVLDWG